MPNGNWTGKQAKWVRVGEAAVDAGVLLLIDPCYLVGDNASRAERVFQQVLGAIANNGSLPDEYVNLYNDYGVQDAVVVHTGYGDGSYPVSVQYDAEGRVAQVKVDFR